MITPAIILYITFNLYPIVSSLGMVTRKWQGMRSTYIGLGNFVRMLNDKIFLQSLGHNFLFMGIQIPIMIMLALVLATILNQVKHGRGTLRTIFFLPCVTSLVAYSVLFRMLFQTNGLLNNLLMKLELIQSPIGWLNDPGWAKAAIMIGLTWRWTGYNMVFFIVGMQNIGAEIFEAADIDGANKWQQFFRITIPLLRPVILFSLVTSISGTMQLLDEPNVLTWEGGPANATMTAALYIYRQAFVLNSDFGYAAALSYIVVIITAGFAFTQMKLLGRRD
jgi:lactose/L-arabinose transport system permease protein